MLSKGGRGVHAAFLLLTTVDRWRFGTCVVPNLGPWEQKHGAAGLARFIVDAGAAAAAPAAAAGVVEKFPHFPRV